MKKNDKGEFEVISWEQAYQEIGDKVKAILDSDGPQALAMVQDPRPSGAYYTKRFMDALGWPNCYTHGAACNISKASGFSQVIGAGDFSADVENSKMIMYIGRSVADAVRPAHLLALQKAHDNGAKVVMVDPRCNNSTVFADEWLPINPGTDLAFLLAMSHVLIRDGIYDAAYVAENVVGFDEFAAGVKDCTPAWAERSAAFPPPISSAWPSSFPRRRLLHASTQDGAALSAIGVQLRRNGSRHRRVQYAARLLEPKGRRAVPSQRFRRQA